MPNTVSATPPPPPLQTPAPVHSSPPPRPPIAPFVLPVVVLLIRVILQCPCASSHALTDQRVDRLLRLSLKPRKLLLCFPLEIPVRPFRRNVEHVLQALSRAPCWRVLSPTSS